MFQCFFWYWSTINWYLLLLTTTHYASLLLSVMQCIGITILIKTIHSLTLILIYWNIIYWLFITSTNKWLYKSTWECLFTFFCKWLFSCIYTSLGYFIPNNNHYYYYYYSCNNDNYYYNFSKASHNFFSIRFIFKRK